MTDINALPHKTPRGVKIALAVSVAINLAVVGLVGGLAWNGGPPGHGDRMVRDLGFGPFDGVFSPQDRDALRQTIVSRLGDFRSMRQEMMGDMGAILTALRAEPYEAAAVSAAFDAQARHLTDRLTLGSSVVRDYVAALPPEARLAFAGRLEQVMQHGPEHGGKAGPGPGN